MPSPPSPAPRSSRRARLRRLLRAALASVPNRLSLLRLALVPVLWVPALLRLPAVVGVGVAVAGATDLLDGWIARRTGRTTRLGSGLDSAADHLLSISLVAWLLILRPGFFRAELPLLAAWMGLALTALAVGLLRFRRPVDLHRPSGRTATFVGMLFAVHLLLAERYSRAFFLAAFAVACFAALEAIVLLLVRPRDADGGASRPAA